MEFTARAVRKAREEDKYEEKAIFLDVRKSAHHASATAAQGPERSTWALLDH